jgi:hypothetical protein
MPTKPIEFRVDEAVVKELDRQASARGLNRAQFLRTIVIDALSDRGYDVLVAKIDDLERLTASLRENLRKATGAVLRDLQTIQGKDKKMDVDLINAWLAKNLE